MADFVGVDEFASSRGGIIEESFKRSEAATRRAVKRGASVAKREVIENASNLPLRNMAGSTMIKYVTGFTYRTKAGDGTVEAVIGNENAPGLVHLLEKGHAKVGGGRVQGYEHVKPAADEAFDKTFEFVQDEIGSAL